MKDFFISYNAADRHWAEWIAWSLEEAGYTTTLQAWEVLDREIAARRQKTKSIQEMKREESGSGVFKRSPRKE